MQSLRALGLSMALLAAARAATAAPDVTSPDEEALPELLFLPAVVAPGDDAPWPEDGRLSVQLSLEVANDGTVLGVEAPDSVDAAFAGPAVDAALSARFRAARDATGEPVDARVQLQITFDRDAPPPLSIEGRARQSGSRLPLASLRVTLRSSDGRELIATTAEDGTFAFAGLDDGSWTLSAQGPGLQPTSVELSTRAGRVQEVDLPLVRDVGLASTNGVGAELVVYEEAPPAQVTERPLAIDLARVLPGTNGDVVKVVQSLPGVARAPLGTSNLIIRGMAPEDSAGFLDGTPLPIVFHFGGLSTVIAGQSVAEVGYVPGNAGVRYGRFLGGLVDIRTRDDLPEHPSRSVRLDLFQAGLFLDTPLGKAGRTGLELSARRSYVDTVFQPILDARAVPVRAPVYADLQGRLLHRFDNGARVELLVLGSRDTVATLGAEGDSLPTADLAVSFWRLRSRLLQPVGRAEHELSLTVGVDTEDFLAFGTNTALEQVASVAVREEWRRPDAPDQLGWRAGLDLWCGREVFVYDIPSFGPFEAGTTPFFAPALYAELSARLGPLTATPGLRGDLSVYPYDAVSGSLDPRLQTRWALDEVWSIIAASGTYSRLPAARQVLSSSDGNPSLLAERAWQNSLGLQGRPSPGVLLELTGYANRLDRRIVGREDRFRFSTPPLALTGPVDEGPYENAGTGFIFGSELFARLDRPRFTGWLAASVSHSRRIDRPGEEPSLFSYDQPVVLTALGTTTLPKNWRLGSRLRVASGNPYTPVVQRFQDMESREFVPVYGALDSERLATFWGVDLRVDKTWTFDHWRLTGSVDVQNIGLRSNEEVPAWNATYSEFTPIAGLPPLPVFGVEGEW